MPFVSEVPTAGATAPATTTAAPTESTTTAVHPHRHRSSSSSSSSSCIVVVAKGPVPGQCKTRLVPALGAEGSAGLARAMLADVLTTLSHCNELDRVDKILLYAPPTNEGRAVMEAVLADFCIPVAQWTLQPVVVSTTVTTAASGTIHHHHHSQSSDLSEILQTALQQARQRRPNTTVVFLGMDAPQLPLTELIAVCGDDDDDDTRATTTALLCPAADGGYGLLSVPPHADATAVFRNVVWSHPLTALSQLKALTDAHIRVTLGPLMHDVDEFSDVVALARRLGPQACGADGTAASESSLSRPSALVAQFPFATTPDATTMTTFSSCRYTRQALMDLGLLPS